MKIKMLAILFALCFCACAVNKPAKEVKTETVCDTAKMRVWYEDCMGMLKINSTSDSAKIMNYYRNDCMKEAKMIYCKEVIVKTK